MTAHLRDITPMDKPALTRFHARLSADTRYRRYHAMKGDLTHGDLKYLTEVDGHRHVALVAENPQRPGELLGVARLVGYEGRPEEAELAIVVADDTQAAGVGGVLMEALLRRGAEEGYDQLVAEVQADNFRALRFFQGFGARQRALEGSVRELVLPTRSPAPAPSPPTPTR
jgi:acetyltransferase